MIGYMGSQQKKQLEGLEELATFTSREMRMFMTNIYPCLLEQLHQTVAKASLALEWVKEDAVVFDNAQELSSLLSSIENISSQVCIMIVPCCEERILPCSCRCIYKSLLASVVIQSLSLV